MTQKELLNAIAWNKSQYVGIYTIDSTVRFGFDKFSIIVRWKGLSKFSIIKTMNGRNDSVNANDELLRYQTTVNNFLNQ